jgi:ubiquinone/menaquinone biosynthesis C-methylase UbiE
MILIIINFLISGITNLNCQSQHDSVYTYHHADPDGTGKCYLRREIAQVMDFGAADWLERNNREKEENTALAIAHLPIKSNSVVADIGAGTGYYTFRIQPKVPQGKVFAVEIQDGAIKYLKERASKLKNNNVDVIKGTKKSPNLPANSTDLAIMVDVYHELLYPHEMLQAIKRALKPRGKLLLLEYRAEDPEIAIKELHKMSVNQANKELNANGFHLVTDGEFMPIQHFLIYEKN